MDPWTLQVGRDTVYNHTEARNETRARVATETQGKRCFYPTGHRRRVALDASQQRVSFVRQRRRVVQAL